VRAARGKTSIIKQAGHRNGLDIAQCTAMIGLDYPVSEDVRNDEDFHRFIPPVVISACGYSFLRTFPRTIKNPLPAKNDRKAAKIAIKPLFGLYFLSGILGESMTLKPNCSRFRAIISRSTSCPYSE